MSITFCEKCLEDIIKNEIKLVQSMLTEDGNTYDYEPTQLKLEDLFLDDEDDKNQYLAFYDNNKYKNWYYQVYGKPSPMFHPEAEKNLAEVQNMLEECLDDVYSAGDGNYQILINNTIENKIKVKQLINKKVRNFINLKKNKSDSFIYLTIRPDYQKIEFEEFKKKIQKLFKMKCIKEYYYCYEQKYGSEEKDKLNLELKYKNLGDGYHIHALIKFNENQNFANAHQQLIRSCKALKYYFESKRYISDSYWQDKLYYIGVLWTSSEDYEENFSLDYKNSLDKNKCLIYDKEFRKLKEENYIISSKSEIPS